MFLRRSALKRSRKRIKARAKFKAHGGNLTKTYRRRFTDYQVMIRANICRQERLRDRTPAEVAFSAMLDDLRILYEVEKIFRNCDRWVLLDFYFSSARSAFEIDGKSQVGHENYESWARRMAA